jgi:hypothetical protein
MKITNEDELASEASNLACQGMASDLAQVGRVTPKILAECVIDQLYGRIEFEITPKVQKNLAKSLAYYC